MVVFLHTTFHISHKKKVTGLITANLDCDSNINLTAGLRSCLSSRPLNTCTSRCYAITGRAEDRYSYWSWAYGNIKAVKKMGLLTYALMS